MLCASCRVELRTRVGCFWPCCDVMEMLYNNYSHNLEQPRELAAGAWGNTAENSSNLRGCPVLSVLGLSTPGPGGKRGPRIILTWSSVWSGPLLWAGMQTFEPAGSGWQQQCLSHYNSSVSRDQRPRAVTKQTGDWFQLCNHFSSDAEHARDGLGVHWTHLAALMHHVPTPENLFLPSEHFCEIQMLFLNLLCTWHWYLHPLVLEVAFGYIIRCVYWLFLSPPCHPAQLSVLSNTCFSHTHPKHSTLAVVELFSYLLSAHTVPKRP